MKICLPSEFKESVHTKFSKKHYYSCLVICFCASLFLLYYSSILYIFNSNVKKEKVFHLHSAKSQVDILDKNIFFLESSGTGNLTARQACSVEAALITNAGWQIHILFTKDITDKRSIVPLLRDYLNIRLSRIKTKAFVMGTPYYSVMAAYPETVRHRDVLKFLTLLKFPGIFVEWDILAVKSFDDLDRDWVVKVRHDRFSSAILSLTVRHIGRTLSSVLARQLVWKLREIEERRPKGSDREFGNIGDEVLTRALKKFCHTSYVPSMDSHNCDGLQIFDTKQFPLRPEDMVRLLGPLGDLRKEWISPYFYYMKDVKSFSKVAQKYCPSIFEEYGYEGFDD